MKIRIAAAIAYTLLLSTPIHAAEKCSYTQLSKRFSFEITKNSRSIINIHIIRKSDHKPLQDIILKSETANQPLTCKSRSYVTHYHENDQAVDGMYGDIVVADLNFNGREDIAIADDFTNGYGQLYKFYFQDANGLFLEDENFLKTGQTEFPPVFPSVIDAKNKTLTFTIKSGAVRTITAVFKYDPASEKWQLIKTTKRTYQEGKLTNQEDVR